MLKGFKKVVPLGVVGVIVLGLLLDCSVFAAGDGVVKTTLFGNVKDDGTGCGVFTILNLVIDFLSMGVGILCVIGIAVVGIQYLTAKSSPDQVEKAKKRLYAILIGMAAYAVMYAGLQWLMPGGKLNTGQKCETVSDEEYDKMKEEEKEKMAGTDSGSDSGSSSSSSSDSGSGSSSKDDTPDYKKTQSYKKCMKNAAKAVKDDVCKIEDPAKRLAKTAKLLAAGGSKSKASQKYKSAYKEMKTNMGACESYGMACNTFVATVIAASGVDTGVPSKRNGHYSNNTRDMYNYFLNHPKKWKKIGHNPSKSKEGDVVVKPRPGGHITITVKNSKGKLVTAHASNCGFYPVVSSSIYTGYSTSGDRVTVFRYIGD